MSPSVGELDDAGQIGMDVVESIVRVYDNYGLETQICVQGIQNPIHVLDAAALGADVATVPFAVLDKLFDHPLTAQGASRVPARRPAERMGPGAGRRSPGVSDASRERAVDLSHRIVERLGKTPGVALAAEREFLEEPHPPGAPRVGQGERADHGGREGEDRRARAPRRRGLARMGPPLAEEIERAYAALLARGE